MEQTEKLVAAQRAFFETNATKPAAFRKKQLLLLKQAILEHEGDILAALKADLNKAPFEAFSSEVGTVLEELSYMLRHVEKLARPKRVAATITQFPAGGRIMPEPYGVALIMSPWNYPFLLTLSPLIGAIAAGNCAVVKPSNYSLHTSAVIRDILRDVFPPQYIDMVEGGRDVNTSLLNQKFDYIFFTGGVAVGKTVMASAAKHLTPVTLELGGKSPCIVDETARIPLAAKRIAWGKFLNAGQTCIAPDYVLAHAGVKDRLAEEIWRNVRAFYGENTHQNDEFPKIITEKHFNRIAGLIAPETGVRGGRLNAETRQIEPTLLCAATWDSPAMREEIFGPVLPILEYTDLGDAIAKIKARPKPLALYLFTQNAAVKRRVLSEVSFGGGCVNDTIMHMPTSRMPFGGVGESGIGAYHGKASFATFSHMKSVLARGTFMDVPLRYPPYKNKLGLIKKVMK